MAKIKSQVEFYFSDSNYPRDSYLRDKAEGDGERYVDLDALTNFNLLNKLHSGITAEVLSQALQSGESNVVELSENKLRVRRKNPIPLEDVMMPRSVAVTPIPRSMTWEQVKEVFEKHAKVLSVRVRHPAKSDDEVTSAFVEFDSEESAVAVRGKDIEVEGSKLRIVPKASFIEEIKAEKKKQRKEQKESAKQSESTKKGADHGAKSLEGCIVAFKGVGGECSREVLKDLFGQHGNVAFVDYEKGQTEGKVRFYESDEAKAAAEAFKGGVQIGGGDAEVALLEGESEQEYIREVIRQREQRRVGGRGKGKGRAGRGGKRSRDAEGDDGPAPKTAKSSDE